MKPTALLREQHAACSRPTSTPIDVGGSRFTEWMKDFDLGSGCKTVTATHSRPDGGKMCMTLERPRDPRKEFWKGQAHVSKAKVRELAQKRHETMVEQEKALHERLRKEGLGITKTFDPPRPIKWKGAHKENTALGMDRKVEAKEKAAALRARRKQKQAERQFAAKAAKKKEEAEENRLAESITIDEVEKILPAHLKGAAKDKLHGAIVGYGANVRAADGDCATPPRDHSSFFSTLKSRVTHVRRLSMATVVKMAMMGIRAKRQVKQRARTRARYKREKAEMEQRLRYSLEENEAAAKVRHDMRERHKLEIEALHAKQARQLTEFSLATPRRGAKSKDKKGKRKGKGGRAAVTESDMATPRAGGRQREAAHINAHIGMLVAR